jgi:transposase
VEPSATLAKPVAAELSRGWAGPSLLAMILFEKFGQHQPLNRQAERYAREGVPLSLSTLADQVGGGCAVLAPLLL